MKIAISRRRTKYKKKKQNMRNVKNGLKYVNGATIRVLKRYCALGCKKKNSFGGV